MYLIHSTDENNLINILEDGYLKPSSKTKNIRMYGQKKGSKYIYLRLNKKNDIGNLYFDFKFLLTCTFYLNIGWKGEITEETIKVRGQDLTEEKLKDLLKKFSVKTQKYYKDFVKKNQIPIMMSNEILIKKNISLQKYLNKIFIINKTDKLKNILNNKYHNVKILK